MVGFLGGFNWLAGLSLRLRLNLILFWGFLGSTRPLLGVVVVVIVVAVGVNVLWGRAAATA